MSRVTYHLMVPVNSRPNNHVSTCDAIHPFHVMPSEYVQVERIMIFLNHVNIVLWEDINLCHVTILLFYGTFWLSEVIMVPSELIIYS